MQFSNTSTKQGLLQDCEFWTNLGDGGITGNSFLKSQFTNRINRRHEMAMARLGLASRLSQSDDTNYTNQPFSYFDIVSGVNDYQFLQDADGNSISDITAVLILQSTTATEFIKLTPLTLDRVDNSLGNQTGHLSGISINDAELIMSPNSNNTGIPTGYIERNNTIFFDKLPNYSKLNGGKLFYKRVPSYFVVGDTTKEAGFPEEYHQMLSLGASFDYLLTHKSNDGALITRIEIELNKIEKQFLTYSQMRNPVKNRAIGRVVDAR